MPTTPTFSVVIPTRNRAVTLKSALRTCLDLDHPSFEVVVSDNDSSDDTAAVVAAFGDARIRYFKTPAYLSMARNFENGLKHARGEFLIFIGDDDGILPFGLRVLEAIFEGEPDLDAIDWALNAFLWPHMPSTKLTLNWISNLRGPEIETAEQAWHRINHPRSTDYNDLNGFNLYHGCLRRRVIEGAEQVGVSLFASPIPDVAAGIRALRFARKKLRLDVAITINGTSHMSNGWAHYLVKPAERQLQIRADFHAKTAADFPNSALVQYSWNRPNSFLGPLIDEHLDRYGDLRALDLQPWRMVYIEYLLRLSEEQLEALLPEVNSIFDWVKQKGAANANPLSADDVNLSRPAEKRLPHFFALPFRFSTETLAAAAGAPGIPHVRIADPRLISMAQGEKDIVLNVRSAGGQFTIHDYVQLTTSVMRCDPFDTVKLLVEDPAVFRSRVVSNVLGHLTAG